LENQFEFILCTCPDEENATQLAYGLISEHLAACANIIPDITSIYPWEEKIEISKEQLLVIKSQKVLYPRIESYIVENHPYELPEIIAVPIRQGLPGYLGWIQSWTNVKHHKSL